MCAETAENGKIILASKSQSRLALLENAGLAIEPVPSGVNENFIKTQGEQRDKGFEEIALDLARAKAQAVASKRKGYVIGADQILGCDGVAYDKPETLEEAASRLMALQGKTHCLYTALCVFRDGVCDFTDIAIPALTMRPLSKLEIDAYIRVSGSALLTSVGAYQLEGMGARLFTHIDGQYFDILGLQLLPLLAYFRAEKVMEF